MVSGEQSVRVGVVERPTNYDSLHLCDSDCALLSYGAKYAYMDTGEAWAGRFPCICSELLCLPAPHLVVAQREHVHIEDDGVRRAIFYNHWDPILLGSK